MIAFLDGLSNDSLKKEATSEARSETSSIMKVHTYTHTAPVHTCWLLRMVYAHKLQVM